MIGNPTPDVTYGFTLGLGYKNWELAVDMMGQGGNPDLPYLGQLQLEPVQLYGEQRMDRWHGEGTSNTQPLLNTKHTINNLNSGITQETARLPASVTCRWHTTSTRR